MKRVVCLVVVLLSVFAQAVPEEPGAETFKRFTLPPSGTAQYVWDVLAEGKTIIGTNTTVPSGMVVDANDHQLTLTWDSEAPGLYTATIELQAAVAPYAGWTGPAILVSQVGQIQWWVPGEQESPFIYGQRDIVLP